MLKFIKRDSLTAYGFLFPAYSLYVIFLLLPLAAGLVLAFFYTDRFTLEIEFVGFENFTYIFEDPRFWISFKNTFHFISLAVIMNVGVGLLLALLLDRAIPSTLLYFFRFAYFMPVLMSLAFASFVWQFLYSQEMGILNYYVQKLGFKPIGWITDSSKAMFSIVILDVWKNVGFFMVVILSALQNVPKHIIEASKIDGASELTTILRIKIPYIYPVLFFCVIIATIGGLQVFDSILIITNGGPGDATTSVVMYLVSEAFSNGDIGAGTATALILLIVILIVTTIQFTFVRLMEGINR